MTAVEPALSLPNPKELQPENLNTCIFTGCGKFQKREIDYGISRR